MIRIRERHKQTQAHATAASHAHCTWQYGLAEGFCFLTTLRKNCIASIARYTQIQIQIEIKK